jgi:hypothetical protein
MLQIFSHTLWSLALRRVDCDKATLLELIDAFLTPRQPQQIHWRARPFLGRTFTTMSAHALSSNVSQCFHVLAGVEVSHVSTTRWARKGHLIRMAKLKPVSKGTLDLEGRPPLHVSCGKMCSSHGDLLHFRLHYPGTSQANAVIMHICTVHAPLIVSCTMRAENGTRALINCISAFHSSNIILNFNKALDHMFVMTSIQTALLLALSVGILALSSCRQLALYLMMMPYEVSKLPRPCCL